MLSEPRFSFFLFCFKFLNDFWRSCYRQRSAACLRKKLCVFCFTKLSEGIGESTCMRDMFCVSSARPLLFLLCFSRKYQPRASIWSRQKTSLVPSMWPRTWSFPKKNNSLGTRGFAVLWASPQREGCAVPNAKWSNERAYEYLVVFAWPSPRYPQKWKVTAICAGIIKENCRLWPLNTSIQKLQLGKDMYDWIFMPWITNSSKVAALWHPSCSSSNCHKIIFVALFTRVFVFLAHTQQHSSWMFYKWSSRRVHKVCDLRASRVQYRHFITSSVPHYVCDLPLAFYVCQPHARFPSKRGSEK